MITNFSEKVPFWVCNRPKTVYTGIRNGVERSPRGETGSSNRMGSTLYLSVIVVSVRVTRISTDGCAVRMQFVVGLHSAPYLFNQPLLRHSQPLALNNL